MKIFLTIVYVVTILVIFRCITFMKEHGSKRLENKFYMGALLGVILWCLSQILIFLSANNAELFFSYLIGNVGVCFVGSCWLIFTIMFCGRIKWNKWFVLLLMYSVIMYIFILTNPMHGLYYADFGVGKITYGILYYINITYDYICVIAGIAVIFLSVPNGGNSLRVKLALIVSVSIPLIVNSIYQLSTGVVKYDLTPVGFAISCTLVLIMILRFNVFDVKLSVFDDFVGNMKEGIIIFNERGEPVYYNDSFKKIFFSIILQNYSKFNCAILGAAHDKGEKERNVKEKNVKVRNDGEKNVKERNAGEKNVKVRNAGEKNVKERNAEVKNIKEKNVKKRNINEKSIKARDYSLNIKSYEEFKSVLGAGIGKDKTNELDNDSETLYFTDTNGSYHIRKYSYKDELGQEIGKYFILSDISRYYEMKKKENRLLAYRQKLEIEQEHNRIVQIVHDSVGHNLTMIRSMLKIAMKSIDNWEEEPLKDILDNLISADEIAGNSIKELRETINSIRGNRGTNQNADKIITERIADFINKIREINIELNIQGEEGIKHAGVSDVVFDNVKEAVTNTLRYGNAGKMDIVLRFYEDRVEVYIFDNGNGCDGIKYGNGLRGMQDRVARAGGSIRFISARQEGFRIIMKLPVRYEIG